MRIRCALLVLLALPMTAAGCSASGGDSSSAGGDSGYDIKTMTCSDEMAVDPGRRTTFEGKILKIMADNEGLKVTDSLTNSFVVKVHTMCDADPGSLWASTASVAFTNAVLGR